MKSTLNIFSRRCNKCQWMRKRTFAGITCKIKGRSSLALFFSEKPGKQNCSGVSENLAEQEITMCFLPEVSLKHVYGYS